MPSAAITENVHSGHAPGHYRDRFAELVETRECTSELVAVAGKLWNCTDIAPGSVCAELDAPAGSTYAQLARRIRGH